MNQEEIDRLWLKHADGADEGIPYACMTRTDFTAAIQTATAQARREALEEAKKRCMELAAGFAIEGMHKQHLGASDCAYSIGALAAQEQEGKQC